MYSQQIYNAYGTTMHDLCLDAYYIINACHGSVNIHKWYLREFDEKTNQVLWVSDIKRACEFHSKAEAMALGKATKRKFDIEEVEDWIF